MATLTITNGDILVCITQQMTGCGIIYLKEGSIVECALTPEEYHSTIHVYRNAHAKRNNSWHAISRRKLRIATEKEIEMHNKGIYFIESVNAK